jgi:hypothetical protein
MSCRLRPERSEGLARLLPAKPSNKRDKSNGQLERLVMLCVGS